MPADDMSSQRLLNLMGWRRPSVRSRVGCCARHVAYHGPRINRECRFTRRFPSQPQSIEWQR